MDDLKLIAKSEEELQKQIQTLKTFSDDIHMAFVLEKCAKVTFRRGKLIQAQNLMIDTTRELQELEQGKKLQVLRDRRKGWHTTPVNEGKITTGI